MSQSDKTGQSTAFVKFMLSIIEEAQQSVIATQRPHLSNHDRLMVLSDAYSRKQCSRLDYLMHFKVISSASASRDLRFAVDHNILKKYGDKRFAKYQYS